MIVITLAGFADLVEHYDPDLELWARLLSDELFAHAGCRRLLLGEQ
ncbi:hypothetical protein [Natrialba taiwanensis]|nr:hypothetical protein [Natrialba taiwanensis]